MNEQAPADATAWINDMHWGQGGRYVFDPATGQRTRQDDPASTENTPAIEAEQPMKGKKHG